jgi:hypothetical protein
MVSSKYSIFVCLIADGLFISAGKEVRYMLLEQNIHVYMQRRKGQCGNAIQVIYINHGNTMRGVGGLVDLQRPLGEVDVLGIGDGEWRRVMLVDRLDYIMDRRSCIGRMGVRLARHHDGLGLWGDYIIARINYY